MGVFNYFSSQRWVDGCAHVQACVLGAVVYSAQKLGSQNYLQGVLKMQDDNLFALLGWV